MNGGGILKVGLCLYIMLRRTQEGRVSGKILNIADPYVEKIYGSIVDSQIDQIGRNKEETAFVSKRRFLSISTTMAVVLKSKDNKCLMRNASNGG